MKTRSYEKGLIETVQRKRPKIGISPEKKNYRKSPKRPIGKLFFWKYPSPHEKDLQEKSLQHRNPKTNQCNQKA